MGPSMNTASQGRGICTLAYGHQRFVEQARSLAHSLQVHAPHLPRTLITDTKSAEICSLYTQVVPYRPDFGSGVRQKMFLDQYSPYDKTLFVDSDCLVLSNLDAFWLAFEGQYFGVPGFKYLYKGTQDPYMDVDHVLEKLQLTSVPKFNGGTYYFTRSQQAANFFETARKILDDWRDLGLKEFRGNGPGDEAVYAVAMAIHGIGPTSMGVGGMWTPASSKGPLHLDSIQGTCSFEKEGKMLSPEVIHFPGMYVHSFAYGRERERLKMHVEGKRTPLLRSIKSSATSVLWQCSQGIKGLEKLIRLSVRAYRSAARFARS
jgi:hypothetical protein